ncbi:MAG: cupin domain-containing protein [Myxococcales bacterium]|nr:cupin domain-containing protein [Myxococcales bacterium]
MLSDAVATAGRAAVLELSIPPRTFGAPPHVHSREDEHFYVLEGNVEFLDRERTISAGPGTLVVLPRHHLHGFWNASDEPARMLLIVTPGEFASFFDEVVVELRRSQAADAQAVGRIIGEVAARHGVEIFPDRVPESARDLVPR